MADARSPVFYGWWIALAAAIGMCLGGPPILVFSFPIFLKALAREFHASRSAIAFAFSLHNVVSAFAAPFAGRLIDRIGARKVIWIGTVLLATLLIGNRLITVSVFGIYAFNILGALVGMFSGPISYSALVSKWFDRRRGAGLAVMMSGLGMSAVLMPSLVQYVITTIGWRAAYAFYGAAMLLISMPILVVLLKETPAQLGLLADGAPSSSFHPYTAASAGVTPGEARRTATFWILAGAIVLLGASVHACVIHLAAMLTDQGISAQTAALASSLAGAGVLAGRVGTGFLLDRFFGPRVAVCCSTGAGLGIALLLIVHTGWLTFVAAFFAGLGMGAEADVIAYLTGRYFGLKFFGEIYGSLFGAFVLAGACGALLMGVGFDHTGAYTVPLVGFLVAIVVAIGLFSRLGPYQYLPLPTPQPEVEYRVAAVAR